MPLLIVNEDGSYRRPFERAVKHGRPDRRCTNEALGGQVALRSLASHLHIIARFPLGSLQQAAIAAAIMERHRPRRVLFELFCGAKWIHLICDRETALQVLRRGETPGRTDTCSEWRGRDRLEGDCLPDLG
jgi:hypothetical protein